MCILLSRVVSAEVTHSKVPSHSSKIEDSSEVGALIPPEVIDSIRVKLLLTDWPPSLQKTMGDLEMKDALWKKFLYLNYETKRGFQDAYCKLREIYLKKQIKKAQSIQSVINASADITRLIILGETHVDRNGKDVYPKILRDLKKKDPNLLYLFVEHRPRHQPLIDAYLSGKLSFSEYDKKLRAAGASEGWLNQEAFMGTAKELGLKIECVDTNENSVDFISWQGRNEAMAKNVVEHFKKNSTDKGVLITGAGHISPHKLENGRVPVPVNVLLTASGILNKAFLITRPRQGELSPSEFAPPDCSWRVPFEAKPFGFIPDADSRYLITVPFGWNFRKKLEYWNENRAQFWDDYDGVLYFPEKLP